MREMVPFPIFARWETAQKNPLALSRGFFVEVFVESLDQARLDQGVESSIFADRFDRLAGKSQLYVVAEFRHPDAFVLEVRRNFAFHDFGDVTTDTAFFLGETGTMNASTTADV